MHPIFSITAAEIQKLSDEQARELVARLCRAELRKLGVSESAVSWGGDQRAKDGGVDVRVDVEPTQKISGYIKNDRSAFQVKAEKFNKGKLPGEMAPNGVLRPAIVDLANSNGAYIVVSTRDSLSDSSRTTRINAMAKCLSDNGLSGKVIVDFYDSRKIADWVEQHPAIVNWVRHIQGKPLVGWRPYTPWAYQETDIAAEYLVDDRVKVLLPDIDEGKDILFALNRLRDDLSKNASVRIVGLSGVGKTRLVQALFDSRITTDNNALDPENVLHSDLADHPTPQPNAMLEALVAENSDCVVVVDNCGPDVHQRLTEIARRAGSKIRLVTIEYDIRDDLPEGTICYRLEGSSNDVIKELLKRRFNVLSDTDLDKIAEFSDGNARVAFALASTTETTGELARLRDAELFRRLFVQNNVESNEILQCAEAASLLYSFDGEDISSSSEMAILAALAEVSIITFSRNILVLQRRGLVQERGKWRAVLPHAISNRLAAQALDALPTELLIKVLVENASDRVARSFSRRLGFLHQSKIARSIVEGWVEPNGRYGGLRDLDEIGRQIFTNIAPVHQEAALDALERAAKDPEFISTDNHHRSYFTRVARSLAYDAKLFDRAVVILMQFAMAEHEGYNHEPATAMLKSLFHAHLSGTEAPPTQRSQLIRELIQSSDERKESLGFKLLEAALEATHFTSIYGFDFGARKRGFGWSPRTLDDVKAWYKPFMDIAVDTGQKDNQQGRTARALLGEAVRGLWVNAGLSHEIHEAANKLVPVDGWPEGWLGAKRVLQWDKENISAQSLQEVRELEQALSPRDLKTKIIAKVLAPGSFADDLEEHNAGASSAASRYQNAGSEAEDLGKSVAHEPDLLLQLLPDLLSHSTNSKVWNFGVGVGKEIQDPIKLLAEVRHLVATSKPGSVSLIFLRGFISGLHAANPRQVTKFLDDALDDEVWVEWFPELQLRVDLDDIGYGRILKSLGLGKTPVWQYKYLGIGRVTEPLTVNQISILVDAIAKKSDDGLLVAIDVLAMVVYSAREKDADYRLNLAYASLSFLQGLDWSKLRSAHGLSDYNVNSILEFVLKTCQWGNGLSDLLHNLVVYERGESRSHRYGKGKLLTPFFENFPKETLDAVYVADDDGKYRTASRIVSNVENDRRETAIRKVPVDTLIEWCEVSPYDRYIFAANTCSLFGENSSAEDESTRRLCLSEVAIQVLAHAPDKKVVVNAFVERFRPPSWSGSLASVLKERLPLLADLNPTGDEAIRLELEHAEAALGKHIAAIEAQEEAEERERTGSFE